METTFDPQTNSYTVPEPARPQFLSVLCILTWVCCGILFIMTLKQVFFKESAEEQLEKIEQLRAISPEAADQMEAALENQGGSAETISTVLGLIAVVLSGYGAWLMWNLKKTGFYLYLAGELVPYLGFLFKKTEALEAAGSMSGMGSAFVGIAIGLMVLFDAIFIAMYAANVKYMNK